MKNTFKIIALVLFLMGSGTPAQGADEGQGFQSVRFIDACRDSVNSLVSFMHGVLEQFAEQLMDENGHLIIVPWPYLGDDEDYRHRPTAAPSMGDDEELF